MGSLHSILLNAIKSISSIISLLRALSADFNDALKRASESPGVPNPKPTEPYWLQDPPFPELVDVQSLKLPSTADVAIIGSGIAGAAIARSLLHERRRTGSKVSEKVIIFEARQLCSGATARNGGHIKASPHESFARISKTFGKERAAALVRFQNKHLDSLVNLCRSEGIEAAEARKVETVDFFLDNESFQKAVKEATEIKSLLPEVDMTVYDGPKAREKFGVNGSVVGALRYEAGALWPYRFVASIWKDLLTKFGDTLSIETHTPVESISVQNDAPQGFPYAVHSARGTVYVRHVLHATNAFTSHLVPGLRKKITGIRAHMSAQQPGQLFPATGGTRSWGVIYGGAFDYVTQRPSAADGTQGDVMLGGGFARSLKHGVDQVGLYDDGATVEALTITHIAGVFPAIFHPKWGPGAELKQAWSGIIGVTGDLVPFVGRLGSRFTGRKDEGHIPDGKETPGEWIAAGFCGEGMVWAWLSGVALGIMVAGTAEDDVEEAPGRPGGRLADWFPSELLVSDSRLRTADITNLADEL